MKIVNASGNLTMQEKYQMTMSPKIKRIKDCEGQTFEVAKWCEYADIDKKSGEEKNILSMLTPDGEAIATNSATFKEDFFNIVDMLSDSGMSGTVFSLEVITGTSKAGRQFFTCAYTE